MKTRLSIVTTSILYLLLFALVLPAPLRADDAKHLPPRYRDWIQRDVTYIITHEERDAFLKLPSDAARDAFIQRFWEIRNPDPGAPANEFKTEHYRRLAYADQYFGRDAGTPGWRTDKGRIYIMLGEPQQKAPYYGLNKVRPMEIWFYQNASHPALPPYFSILFYKPDSGGDYKLYSPYMDGPQKLVTTLEGDRNSRSAAFKVIDQDAGREVARTTLSLLPDEPVDIDGATSSLQSDILLSNIKGLPNLPLEKDALNRRREVLESVTHRVILGPEYLNALAVPLRDLDGNVNVHYVLRLQKPEDFTIAQSSDGRYYYNLGVTARVLGPDGKLIFTQETPLSKYFGDQEMTRMKHKTLAVEGWLPLAPGKYKVEFVLNNKLRQTAFRTTTDVTVPQPPATGLTVTQPIPFNDVDAVKSPYVPFSGAGVRFGPMVTPQLELNPADDLTFFYQIWSPPVDPKQNAGKKLIVEYGYGRPGVRGDAKVIREEVPREQFDRSGSLLNGKKIPITDLGPGNYRLIVTVLDPETREKSFSTLNFRVSGAAASSESWYVYSDDVNAQVQDGTLDFQRALCFEANGQADQAAEFFRRAIKKNPKNERALSKVVSLYFARKSFSEIAGLYQASGIDGGTDEETILRIAESFDKTGNTRDAVKVLESALTVKPPSWPLYLALGSYYKQIGDVQKANEVERKGRSLMPANPPTS